MVTDFTAVPDWFAQENVDGGIAIGDIDRDGRPDLVVFMIDAPDGPNAGYYRVGHAIDGSGAVTGGWSPWQQVPNWPFWENAGADCAVADINGDGVPELLLLLVDAPVGQNIGLYRSASLAPDGTANGWRGVIPTDGNDHAISVPVTSINSPSPSGFGFVKPRIAFEHMFD